MGYDMGYDIKWGVCERVWVSRCCFAVVSDNRRAATCNFRVRLGQPGCQWHSSSCSSSSLSPGATPSQPPSGSDSDGTVKFFEPSTPAGRGGPARATGRGRRRNLKVVTFTSSTSTSTVSGPSQWQSGRGRDRGGRGPWQQPRQAVAARRLAGGLATIAQISEDFKRSPWGICKPVGLSCRRGLARRSIQLLCWFAQGA